MTTPVRDGLELTAGERIQRADTWHAFGGTTLASHKQDPVQPALAPPWSIHPSLHSALYVLPLVFGRTRAGIVGVDYSAPFSFLVRGWLAGWLV